MQWLLLTIGIVKREEILFLVLIVQIDNVHVREIIIYTQPKFAFDG